MTRSGQPERKDRGEEKRRRLAGPRRRRVLAIGSDAANLGSMWMRLGNLGFDVVAATSFSGALAAWRARRFDMIAIGSSIPIRSAHAFLQRMGQDGRARPIRLRDPDGDGAVEPPCFVFTLRQALAT